MPYRSLPLCVSLLPATLVAGRLTAPSLQAPNRREPCWCVQKASLLPHFISAPLPPAPLPPVPPLSSLEAIAGFLADAIERVRAEGVWRACHRVHALLHASALAFDGHQATKVRCAFTNASDGPSRLAMLRPRACSLSQRFPFQVCPMYGCLHFPSLLQRQSLRAFVRCTILMLSGAAGGSLTEQYACLCLSGSRSSLPLLLSGSNPG